MSVVSDMVDDGALSMALVRRASFVGVSQLRCGYCRGPAHKASVGSPESQRTRPPRKDCAATADHGAARPGPKKIVRAPRFLQLFTPGNSRSARRGAPGP